MNYSDIHIKKLETLLEEKQAVIVSLKQQIDERKLNEDKQSILLTIDQYTKAISEERRIENQLNSAKINKKESSDFTNFINNSADLNNMDDANKKATHIMCTQGVDAGIKHMFTDQDTGRALTYSEMRARYG